MRSKVMIGLALALTLAACGDRERAPLAAPVAPAFAHAQDLDGTPDLMVDSKRLATSWTLSAETIEEGSCSSVEGGIAPGEHRLLRFTVTTPNVGTADVFVGDPVRHWVANDGMFEFAPCHRHFHFRHYATYELVSASSGAVLLAAKRGFCMVDVHPWGADEPPGPWTYRSCGTFGTPGNQGISVGWADTYAKSLDGQFFVVDGLEGEYRLRITVNPPFACGPDDAARPRDANGFCHMFAEGDYGNNVGQVDITIPDRVGKAGFGPGAQQDLASDEGTSALLKKLH
jgi:lysyl oxidase